jgi:tRNA/rRNA methyltransferase
MEDMLNKIDIVIVNPRNNGNIGSLCRAMKTMGFSSLSVIGKTDVVDEESKVMAVHAIDILKNIKYFNDLDNAVSGSGLVAGITRRRGKKRKYFSILPEELADHILKDNGRKSLVFGNEESGLSDTELSKCNLSVYIPSSEKFPSLNLSHAVQIICYSIFRKIAEADFPHYTPVSKEKLDRLVNVISSSLKNIGFFKQVDSSDMEMFFRDIFARAGLSGRETKRLEVVFRKISGLLAGK